MIQAGDKVMVTAKSDFYAFIDGVVGSALSVSPSGLVTVQVTEFEETLEGGGHVEKTFLVPSDELQLTV